MDLPRPSTYGNRPAYLDKLFHDSPYLPPPQTTSVSPRSTNSSISSLYSDSDVNESIARPLAPSFEADSVDDRISVRSLRLHLSPRFQIRRILSRKPHPPVQETVDLDSTRPCTSHGSSSPKLASPLRPQTPFLSPRRKGHWSSSKSLPIALPSKIERLHCTPCYYFAARNCNGYVFGGSYGDACENCAVCLECMS